MDGAIKIEIVYSADVEITFFKLDQTTFWKLYLFAVRDILPTLKPQFVQ